MSADHTSLNSQVSQYLNIDLHLSDLEQDDIPLLDVKPIIDKRSFSHPVRDSTKQISVPTRFKELEQSTTSTNQCPFCSKTFQHSGSLGRHLDKQKGSPLHPIDEINKLRANVARRGDPESVKARLLERRKEYNRRDYVKQKNRVRRQIQHRYEKVKNNHLMKFYRKISIPKVPVVPSFAFLVLSFLPNSLWPSDPPTAETYRILTTHLENDDIKKKLAVFNPNTNIPWNEKVTISFENWQTLPLAAKREIWNREQRRIAQELLGNLTYFDFAVRKDWATHLMNEKKEQIDVDDISSDEDKFKLVEDAGDKLEDKYKLDDAELAAVAAAAAAAVKGYTEDQGLS
ncbi:hypothetical protein DAMA08_041590 [Martiniozyma asiatica (nom. inval.)]|nr:hypothetical protein DAMA08_041590 [Martiniozyma asiatica]